MQDDQLAQMLVADHEELVREFRQQPIASEIVKRLERRDQTRWLALCSASLAGLFVASWQWVGLYATQFANFGHANLPLLFGVVLIAATTFALSWIVAEAA